MHFTRHKTISFEIPGVGRPNIQLLQRYMLIQFPFASWLVGRLFFLLDFLFTFCWFGLLVDVRLQSTPFLGMPPLLEHPPIQVQPPTWKLAPSKKRLTTSNRYNLQCLSSSPLDGLIRGAAFRHGGPVRKQPIKQLTEIPTSTMALIWAVFPSLMGRFSALNGAAFPS